MRNSPFKFHIKQVNEERASQREKEWKAEPAFYSWIKGKQLTEWKEATWRMQLGEVWRSQERRWIRRSPLQINTKTWQDWVRDGEEFQSLGQLCCLHDTWSYITCCCSHSPSLPPSRLCKFSRRLQLTCCHSLKSTCFFISRLSKVTLVLSPQIKWIRPFSCLHSLSRVPVVIILIHAHRILCFIEDASIFIRDNPSIHIYFQSLFEVLSSQSHSNLLSRLQVEHIHRSTHT